jgi:hypothetical protein
MNGGKRNGITDSFFFKFETECESSNNIIIYNTSFTNGRVGIGLTNPTGFFEAQYT